MTHPLTDTMFQAVPELSRPHVTPTRVAERDAWVRAARGRNRRAVQYRKWALESYKAGRMVDWNRYAKAARQQRQSALEALSHARLEATYVRDNS